MQPPVTPISTQTAQPIWGAPPFGQLHNRLLARSFMWTAIGFIVAFGLTYASYYTLIGLDPKGDSAETLLYVSSFLLFACMMVGVFVRPKATGRPVLLSLVFWTFTLLQGLSIGALMFAIAYYNGLVKLFSADPEYIVNLNLVDIGLVFGVAGLMFGAMAITGYKLSDKAAFRLGRFLMIATTVFLISCLLFSLATIYGRGGWNYDGQSSWVSLVILLASGLLSLGYIAYTVTSIRRSEAFIAACNNKAALNNYALYYGYMMLLYLMQLVRVILGLLIRLR